MRRQGEVGSAELVLWSNNVEHGNKNHRAADASPAKAARKTKSRSPRLPTAEGADRARPRTRKAPGTVRVKPNVRSKRSGSEDRIGDERTPGVSRPKLHVRPRVGFTTQPTVPSGGQAVARVVLGWFMLPIWEYLNDRLFRYMRDNKVLSEFMHLDALKRIVWDECVWWGEPVRTPIVDGRRPESEATDLPSGDGGGNTISGAGQES
jgi:hypothetical protein